MNVTRKHFLGGYVRKDYPSGIRAQYCTALSAVSHCQMYNFTLQDPGNPGRNRITVVQYSEIWDDGLDRVDF